MPIGEMWRGQKAGGKVLESMRIQSYLEHNAKLMTAEKSISRILSENRETLIKDPKKLEKIEIEIIKKIEQDIKQIIRESKTPTDLGQTLRNLGKITGVGALAAVGADQLARHNLMPLVGTDSTSQLNQGLFPHMRDFYVFREIGVPGLLTAFTSFFPYNLMRGKIRSEIGFALKFGSINERRNAINRISNRLSQSASNREEIIKRAHQKGWGTKINSGSV